MPSRRSHKNSHHGCLLCKKRRMKCDESRPICGPCRKKCLPCSFDDSQSCHSPTRSLVENIQWPRSEGIVRLPLYELELLHHWHTATAMSLIENEGLGSVLKTEVPKVGLRHPFVMHSILAISALHLSRHCSEPRRQVYIDIGVRYHSNALTLFIPLLSDVTLENCDGLFACSFLVSSFSFALQCLDTQAPSILMSKVIEVFKLVRGTASIAASARPWIEQGDMRPILKLTQCAQRTALSRHVHEVHGRLEAIINHQADEHCPAQLSASTRAVVVRSTGHLLEIFDFSIASDNQAAILAWPAIIDAEYFQLLRQIEPMSLVTLAHYGAILHIMTSTWWMAGWGKFLVNVAAAYLNETVRSEITWPLGIVNDTSDT